MPMSMVNVWIVGVTMVHGRVRVAVTMWFISIVMRMVCIMRMAMLMFERFMPMGVDVPFRQMEPQPEPHQNSSKD